MTKFSAVMLLAIIGASVSVMFVGDKWATSIPETGSCVLAAVWMLRFASARAVPRLSFILAPFGFVVLWAVIQIQAGWTVYRWQTWLSALYWLSNFAVLFAGIQTFCDSRVREQFLRWLVLFGFAVAVVSSLQALTSNSKVYWTFDTRYHGWVVMGPFVYHNQYAAFIELVLPVALYIALVDRLWRWFWLLISATLYASVFIAGSRAGFLLTSLELIVIPLGLIRDRRLPAYAAAGAAAMLTGMVILLAISAGPGYLLERFRIKDPYSIRRELVESSIMMFRARPLTGIGLGNWATAYPAYASFDDGTYANQAHNDWAQWAVEGGLPMLCLMLALAVWIFPRAIRTGWGCGAAAVLLHCFVDYPIQRPAVAAVFFSLIAAVASSQTEKRKALRSMPARTV